MAVYDPTNVADNATEDAFYETPLVISQDGIYFYAEDQNASTWHLDEPTHRILGLSGLGQPCDNGFLLVNFSNVNRLVVRNKHSQHPQKTY